MEVTPDVAVGHLSQIFFFFRTFVTLLGWFVRTIVTNWVLFVRTFIKTWFWFVRIVVRTWPDLSKLKSEFRSDLLELLSQHGSDLSELLSTIWVSYKFGTVWGGIWNIPWCLPEENRTSSSITKEDIRKLQVLQDKWVPIVTNNDNKTPTKVFLQKQTH